MGTKSNSVSVELIILDHMRRHIARNKKREQFCQTASHVQSARSLIHFWVSASVLLLFSFDDENKHSDRADMVSIMARRVRERGVYYSRGDSQGTIYFHNVLIRYSQITWLVFIFTVYLDNDLIRYLQISWLVFISP